ncbi:MAG: DUF4097 family beta strand repeat protein [Flavobacteriales bacterium]|nr:DUF4097 family beta strand repeat protein [Flavobacteriales bacterium]
MKKSCLLSLALLFGFFCAFAGDEGTIYYKEIKKNFKTNGDVRLDLDISFADCQIKTWDQNVIDIVVKLDVNASSQSRADEMFDAFSVHVNEGMENASLTVNGGINSCNSKKMNESYNINVEIRIPQKAIIDGNTSFGDLTIGDMQGACLINQEYGKLTVNGLWSYENDIRIAFGDAHINGTNGGDFRNEYGKLEIKVLQGNAEIHSSFGDLELDLVRRECKDLEIKIEYADADVNIASDAGFRFDTSASYGDIDLPGSAKKTSVESDYVSKEERGTIGNGEGKLEVECDFGDVDIDIDGN